MKPTVSGAWFAWKELGSAPPTPGLYAWYCMPDLPERDVEEVMRTSEELLSRNEVLAARQVIQKFIERALLLPFRQDDYQVQVRGQLKPGYEGNVRHVQCASTSLVERIACESSRLSTLRQILSECAPYFMAPLYIGMASNLRTRLATHRKLVEKFRQIIQVPGQSNGRPTFDLEADNCFAREIAAREIPLCNLFVITKAVDCDSSFCVDAENLLNRINYPLLGRN